MRLLIVSYQKSGTHQIMPPFEGISYIIDESRNQVLKIPERYGLSREINQEGMQHTIGWIKDFPDRAFGHVSYRPEYVDALLSKGAAKVLFNCRDPRDVIIAEYENIKKGFYKYNSKASWPNFFNRDTQKTIFEGDDPISELIECSAARWPQWLGWLNHDFTSTVKYEDLRLYPKPTMQKVKDQLLPYPTGDIDVMTMKLHPRPTNPTFRRGAVGEWMVRFKPHHKKLAEKLLGDIIERMGYKI